MAMLMQQFKEGTKGQQIICCLFQGPMDEKCD
jgi:hypothetical protein